MENKKVNETKRSTEIVRCPFKLLDLEIPSETQ